MTSGRITVATADGVARVTLHGADGGANTMSRAFFHELPEVMGRIDADDAVRVVVFAGSAGQFSYGLDLVDLVPVFRRMTSSPDARTRIDFRDFTLDGQRSMRAVAACSKPTVAAIEGWCVGGGLALAAACDLRLATREARFAMREAQLGIVADMGGLQWLAGIIGDGHLRRLALTGTAVDAARAERIGLVNEVVDDSAALDESVLRLAAELAVPPALTTRGIKEVLEAERRDRVETGLRAVAEWNAAYLPELELLAAVGQFLTP